MLKCLEAKDTEEGAGTGGEALLISAFMSWIGLLCLGHSAETPRFCTLFTQLSSPSQRTQFEGLL